MDLPIPIVRISIADEFLDYFPLLSDVLYIYSRVYLLPAVTVFKVQNCFLLSDVKLFYFWIGQYLSNVCVFFTLKTNANLMFDSDESISLRTYQTIFYITRDLRKHFFAKFKTHSSTGVLKYFYPKLQIYFYSNQCTRYYPL